MNSQYVLCIKNKKHEVSLELRKVYTVIADSDATRHGQLRIIDESGEDYLYPADFFVPVSIPHGARKAFV